MVSVNSGGLDRFVNPGKRRTGTRRVMALTRKILAQFERVGGKTLVHKSTRELWQISEDGSKIIALYDPSQEPLTDA